MYNKIPTYQPYFWGHEIGNKHNGLLGLRLYDFRRKYIDDLLYLFIPVLKFICFTSCRKSDPPPSVTLMQLVC